MSRVARHFGFVPLGQPIIAHRLIGGSRVQRIREPLGGERSIVHIVRSVKGVVRSKRLSSLIGTCLLDCVALPTVETVGYYRASLTGLRMFFDVLIPNSHVSYAMSHVSYLISHIRYPISHIPYPISHIPYPISHVPCPMSHVPCPLDEVRYHSWTRNSSATSSPLIHKQVNDPDRVSFASGVGRVGDPQFEHVFAFGKFRREQLGPGEM